MRPLLSRRRLLQSGAASLLLPFWTSGRAWAKPSAAKRIIFFYFPDGVPGISSSGEPSQWHCRGEEQNFQLSPLLAPLAPYKSRSLFFNGLTSDYACKELRIHLPGAQRLLTDAHKAEHVSIDQALAQSVGRDTPWNHIYLGVQSSEAYPEPGQHMSYPLPGISVPAQDNPVTAFCDLMQRPPSTAATCSINPASDSMAIDSAMAELEVFRQKLGGIESEKLDFHLHSLEELQKRLFQSPESLEGSSCSVPELALADLPPSQLMAASRFTEILRAQIEIMVSSMECGLGKVGFIQCSNHSSGLYMNEIPNTPMYDLSAPLTSHLASHYGPVADFSNPFFETFTYQRQYFMESFAYLLDQLDSRVEGEGTMLDSSIVVLLSEISDGNTHSLDNMPFIVVGGGAGRLRTGRLLEVGFQPHSDLWIALASAMGLELEAFGEHGTKPLDGVLA